MIALTGQQIVFISVLAICAGMHAFRKNSEATGWAILFVLVLVCGWPK
jgi:uncharacterized membrane protein YqjE